MTKTYIYLASLTGTLSVFADLPIFFVFGGVYIGILLELKKIEKKTYPIISTLYGSVITGWASSFAVKHFYPKLMEGDIRIFSMLVTTIFAYSVVVYFIKNETIANFFKRLLNNFINNKNNENNSDN